MGRNPVFTKEQEMEMADQVKFLSNIFYGYTAIQIRKMAYEYAVHNQIKHNFNNTLRMAGKDWLTGFMRPNKLSFRKAEGLNKAKAFNKHEVSIFFKLLEELMEKYKFLPRNIFNVDETGITSVQDPGKVITENGQKCVGSITSGERGTTVTAVCAVSATGNYIPPMFIYPRQRHSPALENDGPRGAVYRYSKNGWINEDLFIDWLKYFAAVTKPSETEPIILILDNHSSHISLRAYEFCKKNNIVMLSLPPHSSQPLQAKKMSAKPATVRKVKKRLLQDKNKDQSSSDSQIDMADLRDDDDDTDVEDLENKCMLCDDYGRNNELWYRCVQCGLWAHAECSGYESPEGYVCDLCC
ncbi:unnamed protein product [Euphydryas editha]|uniref:DDE-1 domain-containing protein n=1 Tax=Euphydryas editha TaxID=104508 RepID=A0AAU9UKB3_EUPED|nr:unnamed protein product [Euphydryas editha]